MVNSTLLQNTHNLSQLTHNLLKDIQILQFFTPMAGRSHSGTLEFPTITIANNRTEEKRYLSN